MINFFTYDNTATSISGDTMGDRFVQRLNHVFLHFSNRYFRLGYWFESVEDRLAKLEQERTTCAAEPEPEPTIRQEFYERFKAAEAVREVSRARLDKLRGRKIRQAAHAARDWDKNPETAEEAAVRCVRDITQGGCGESGSTTDGVFIRAFKATSTVGKGSRHSWIPKTSHVPASNMPDISDLEKTATALAKRAHENRNDKTFQGTSAWSEGYRITVERL